MLTRTRTWHTKRASSAVFDARNAEGACLDYNAAFLA